MGAVTSVTFLKVKKSLYYRISHSASLEQKVVSLITTRWQLQHDILPTMLQYSLLAHFLSYFQEQSSEIKVSIQFSCCSEAILFPDPGKDIVYYKVFTDFMIK